MDRLWKSWLLPGPEPMSEMLNNSLRHGFNLRAAQDMSPRPEATLDFDGTNWVLGTPDREDFYSELNKLAGSSTNGVLAMSFAPVEQLQMLGNARFAAYTYQYRVSWLGGTITSASDPYARRLVHIAPRERHVPLSLGEIQVSDSPTLGSAALILQPIPLDLDDAGAASCTLNGPEWEGKVWILPPVRAEDHPQRAKAYFSERNLQAREALRETLGGAARSAGEPAAVTANRVTDDPFLRDLFLDGAALRVHAGRRRETSMTLEIRPQPQQDPIAHNRLAIMQSTLDDVPGWAQRLAAELARDLRHAVPGAVKLVSGTGDWSISSVRAEGALTFLEGAWQSLDRIAAAVAGRRPLVAADMRGLLRESNQDSQYDHVQATRSYCLHFWRQPWPELPSPLEINGWNEAFATIRWGMSFQSGETDEDRHALLTDIGAHAAELKHVLAEDEPSAIRYLAIPSQGDLLHWRLVYPLGTVIESGTLILDSGLRSRIDSGLVLA